MIYFYLLDDRQKERADLLVFDIIIIMCRAYNRNITFKFFYLKYGIQPSRRKGQNFLIDKGILEKIIQTATLSLSDVVLEIGPGFGILTKELAKRTKRVVAVEIDKQLAKILREIFKNDKNVEIIEKDILKIPDVLLNSLKKEGKGSYKIVANLPYQITSPVLWRFFSKEPKPSLMILLIQKEVAQRIKALPGEMNLLAILVQFYSEPKIITYISKDSFWPKPKVDSALILLKPRPCKYIDDPIKEKELFQLVKLGFSNRRKQLKNNLVRMLKAEKEKIDEVFRTIGLDLKIRPQNLKIEDWVKLYDRLINQKTSVPFCR